MNINTNNSSLSSLISHLGLTKNEQDLYLASFEKNITSVRALSEELGIKRPNVYKILQSLSQKGLVTYKPNSGDKSFSIESPTRLKELWKNKISELSEIEKEFDEALPNLLGSFKQGYLSGKVKIVNNKKDFISLYEQVFEEASDEILFFGSAKDFIDYIGADLGQIRITRRTQRKIPIRSLLLESDLEMSSLKTNSAELRTSKILKGVNPFITSFYLYSNKILVWQPKTPIAILIEDEYVQAMQKSMFEYLWQQGQDF